MKAATICSYGMSFCLILGMMVTDARVSEQAEKVQKLESDLRVLEAKFVQAGRDVDQIARCVAPVCTLEYVEQGPRRHYVRLDHSWVEVRDLWIGENK